MSLGELPLNSVVTFDECTSDSTGAATDADTTPTYSVFEDTTDSPILAAQSFTKRAGLTGNYRGTFTASAGNGFEAGKWYNVISSATVQTIAGKKKSLTFRLRPAESQAGVPKVDVAYSLGVAVTNGDFTIASATGGGSPTVTLPTTYASGTTLPDDSRYQYAVLSVTTGTGEGQAVLLTTATGTARQYNVLPGTMPQTLDSTSVCVVVGSWRSNTVKLGGTDQTGRDIGASVLLSPGTSTGQISINAGALTVGTNNDKTGYSLSAAGVDAIWDEVQSGHTTAGTFGKYLDSAVSGVSTGGLSLSDIADAVWDEARSGHTTTGTFGAGVVLANGVTHGGNTALMQLERIVVASTTTNQPAVKLTGTGSAAGLEVNGGLTGDGARLTPGSGASTTNGALNLNASGSGAYGLLVQANGVNAARFTTFTGDAVAMFGGLSGGSGLVLTGGSGGGHGLALVGSVAGNDLDLSQQKTNLKLPSAGLANVTAWTVNITGSLSGSVGSVTGGVTVTTNNDKTGYALSATGLDQISASEGTGVAATFATRLMQLWARFFRRTVNDKTGGTIKTYRSNGTTVNTTQVYTDDTSSTDVGAAT